MSQINNELCCHPEPFPVCPNQLECAYISTSWKLAAISTVPCSRRPSGFQSAFIRCRDLGWPLFFCGAPQSTIQNDADAIRRPTALIRGEKMGLDDARRMPMIAR